jgi:hypothetical protein
VAEERKSHKMAVGWCIVFPFGLAVYEHIVAQWWGRSIRANAG